MESYVFRNEHEPRTFRKKLNSIELRTGSREKLDSFYLEK
ncbi:hypothetical protein LEP1GSC083_5287 [Leptospira interrogans serovar Pyrogenes str. L0374]|uniref:Uncharacterized protein n=3 Tax=Leptospira interrogans TaxID=173 RepID=M6ZMD1_LEPIR|nr:hypothetical protein LEP1GSC150_3426 [Leptospira interrogans serovar Copenhageni str. LT2050]EMN30787.1 hypothetical protein LEP1GSC083_5287 [Leptospira interrogans serovar Pyrogenes str. L0374]EMP07256.1 hypothetical protein LEP1GSC124_0823 [Leptospira interrogans serovar Pyrogenes str. 200701872]